MLTIEYVPTDSLIPYANNSRTHNEQQVAQIAASIREFGFTNPVLIDEQKTIIAGHGRVMASQKLGLDKVPTITLSGLTPAQRKAYVIADNKLALNAGWDEEALKVELEGLESEGFDLDIIGFDQSELDEILAEANDGDEEVVPDVKFSEEVGEAHNYVVLYFDNDVDWLSAQTHFDLKTVSSKRANGKEWSKGIGRVINGAKYLTELKK